MATSSIRIKARFFVKPLGRSPLMEAKKVRFTIIYQGVNLDSHCLGFKINIVLTLHDV